MGGDGILADFVFFDVVGVDVSGVGVDVVMDLLWEEAANAEVKEVVDLWVGCGRVEWI